MNTKLKRDTVKLRYKDTIFQVQLPYTGRNSAEN
jgi:hypothetical protein